ncbi:MAG: hypothetical protein QG612_459 [Pseudomonadota bacterium]|nr:hypothetical protein [Pseudomonadota bacterium]
MTDFHLPPFFPPLDAAATADPAARARLEELTRQAREIILARQDPDTGLLPASTAITVHGDYTHAWVRDNVYSIMAVWALGHAWRGRDAAEAEALDARVIHLMRGLLAAMMRQSAKVERFKHTQHPLDALHAKYSTRSGEPVVGDAEWGHLQIDATAIFLLMLVQMSAGGLQIVRSRDELMFVQNLVWYLAHAWRTPDYGIWERGNKRNDGRAEINASSVGMAKAALEVASGARLLADGPAIHVPAEAIAHARHTLENLLPRESESKETDAALLSIIGFPAFAVGDATLVERTRATIVGRLQGRYGCKRFLRDGHQTVVEDHSRLHYEPGELRRFEHIESEWPLFFCYLLLDAVLRGDETAALDYRQRLEALQVEQGGQRLLPELYIVPAESVEAERAAPRSQTRVPNDNVPLVWAQSLYLVGVLLQERLVSPAALLPRGRRPALLAGRAVPPEPVRIQVALLAADRLVQARLAAHGIACQTPEEIAPVQLRYAEDLEVALAGVGRVEALGLSGRPRGRIDCLSTSQVFRSREGDAAAPLTVFLPAFYGRQGFYLTLDNRLLVDELRAELATLRRHWQVRDQQGQPLLTLLVGEPMLEAGGADALIAFLQSLQGGLDEPGVQVGPLAELLPRVRCSTLDGLEDLVAAARPAVGAGSTLALPVDLNWEEGAIRPLTPARAAALEHEEDAHALQRQLARSRNPYEQIEILGLLVRRGGAQWGTERGLSVWQMTQALYERACRERHWGLIRRAAAVLDVHDTALEEAIAQIVARQKRIVVGRSYGDGALIDRPLPSAEIFERIRRFGGDDPRARVLLQEVVLLLGTLIKADAPLLRGTLTLRAWYLILLITGWLAREHGLTQAEGFDFLLSLSPQALLRRLREVIAHEQEMGRNLLRLQSLHGRVSRDGGPLARVRFPASADPVLDDAAGGWLAWREVRGVITRLSDDFHARVWEVLRHFPGLVIGDQLDSRNRLDSHLARADMTASERGFALQVDDLLNKIIAPEYRQLTIEALIAVSDIARANPDLAADGLLVMDVLIGIAVRLGWEQSQPARDEDDDAPPPDYNEHKAAAWQGFYALPPHRVATLVMDALAFLMTPETAEAQAA